MKISYSDFEKTMLDKLTRDGGKSQLTMINGGVMYLWLSDSKNGIILYCGEVNKDNLRVGTCDPHLLILDEKKIKQ